MIQAYLKPPIILYRNGNCNCHWLIRKLVAANTRLNNIKQNCVPNRNTQEEKRPKDETKKVQLVMTIFFLNTRYITYIHIHIYKYVYVYMYMCVYINIIYIFSFGCLARIDTLERIMEKQGVKVLYGKLTPCLVAAI